jgi:hypothetical protein
MPAGAPSTPLPDMPRSCQIEVDRSLTGGKETRPIGDPGYFMAEETLEKVVFRLVPNAVTVAMIATAMPAAKRPYSMAVAPWSSTMKLQSRLRTTGPFPW